MVLLFLHKQATDCGDLDAAKERISLLKKVESIIWSLINSGGRYEARLWLCNTISAVHSITPCDQRDLFVDFVKSNVSKQDVAVQLLQMIFEKRPEKVGPIIARRCRMLEKFFEGNPRRIMQWFDNFAAAGESGHKRELEWKGKHGQSPAVVATKPHYFHDLDVLRTVENFLEYVPDFWSSDELADSVKDGEILQIDTRYFVNQFLQLMYEEKSEDVWNVIEDFLTEEQFSSLSQHLLILLDERRLLVFLKSLGSYIRPNSQCKEFKFPCCWLEILLSNSNFSASLDDVLLLNAVVAKGRQLLRLISDEEHEEERENVEKLLRSSMTFSEAAHRVFMKECEEMKRLEAIKYIGLQSWILYYQLSKECETSKSCESLFVENRIGFRLVDDFSLVSSDRPSNGCDLGSDDEDLGRKGHKKRKRDKKKRRKKCNHDESSPDHQMDFENSNGWTSSQSGARSWRLSTDDFSCVWNIADMPEHLSMHYFRTWAKWLRSKW
uniref:Uncharacterized protein n=1 Tax=Ananas comosus var. bracteatus TaxID=296719 RepID=A0A6V7PMS7_ANACO|nr:unnamed protein product [Ananas comosus var. bracteatus]